MFFSFARHRRFPLRLFMLLIALATAIPPLFGETPALLAEAAKTWDASGQDLAFTQHMTVYGKDKKVQETRVARYDPSRSDRERWRLLEIDGKPATNQERKKWEESKNRRPRNRGGLSPSSYLDLANAKLVEDNTTFARFEVPVLKEKTRLIASEHLAVFLDVDKKTNAITHVSALLRQPMKIALGLAKVTDLDLDLPIGRGDAEEPAGTVDPDATAKLTLTKLGRPTEFAWSDFTRVDSHPDAKATDK